VPGAAEAQEPAAAGEPVGVVVVLGLAMSRLLLQNTWLILR